MGLVKSKTPKEERNRWRTPQRWFELLNKRYGPFTLDAAADSTNHKCDLWLGPDSPVGPIATDALATVWDWQFVSDRAPKGGHRVFCNPPYDYTEEFVEKGWTEVDLDHVFSVTLLVPATPDVKWFHKWVWKDGKPRPNTVVDFSEGRIRFERPDGSLAGSPTHGSMFITFRKEGQARLF